MEINLSNEMIEKIISVALGRLEKLRDEEQNAKEWIKVRSAFEREENLKKAYIYLENIEKAKEDAKEVHELFFELLKEIESK